MLLLCRTVQRLYFKPRCPEASVKAAIYSQLLGRVSRLTVSDIGQIGLMKVLSEQNSVIWRVLTVFHNKNGYLLMKVNPDYSLEGLKLKLKLQYFGHLM